MQDVGALAICSRRPAEFANPGCHPHHGISDLRIGAQGLDSTLYAGHVFLHEIEIHPVSNGDGILVRLFDIMKLRIFRERRNADSISAELARDLLYLLRHGAGIRHLDALGRDSSISFA